MFKYVFIRSLLCIFISINGHAFAADARVDSMGDAFVSGLPGDWNVDRGHWAYFDIARCFQPGKYCYGSNPASPYGFPVFGPLDQITPFQLYPSEAVVIFLRTPPPMRYFGLTQYLMDRGTDGSSIFGSMSDTLNPMRMVTLPSGGLVSSAFNQYAVIVWTADLNTLRAVNSILDQQGISESQVNFIPIPIQLPLDMGYDPTNDSFGMLMRTALPENQGDLDRYMSEKPFYVVKVRPNSPPPIVPARTVGYADEVSGVVESADLGPALKSLVNDIRLNYLRTFNLKAQDAKFSQSNSGLSCIENDRFCAGDNHDALYSSDTSLVIKVASLSDIVIVVGVNHQKTGKATYLNHSVYDTVHFAGITSVDDNSLTKESALYHAGVRLPGDRRVKQYENLYAYVISYDCSNLQYCLSIPAPTPDNPVGLIPGAPFYVVGRSYMEPHTGVRPDLGEIVPHQVFYGIKR